MGVVLTLESFSYENYKEEQLKMKEKNHSLLSYEVLVENCSDGTVKHHFVNANGIGDDVSYKECGQYTEQVYEYHGVTDKDFLVSYSEIFYKTASDFKYNEMPKTDGRYIFDYNVPYYVMDVMDLSLPKEYSFEELYSINELKELEEKLDASIYEKNLNKNCYISDLFLAKVNGKFMCFDSSGFPIPVDETIDETDVTKLRRVYYSPSIENDLINLKLSSGMTEVEEAVINYSVYNGKLVFEDITSLDQSVRNDLRGGTFEVQNIYDYLTDEQIYNGIVTYEEVIQILDELNEKDYQPTR